MKVLLSTTDIAEPSGFLSDWKLQLISSSEELVTALEQVRPDALLVDERVVELSRYFEVAPPTPTVIISALGPGPYLGVHGTRPTSWIHPDWLADDSEIILTGAVERVVEHLRDAAELEQYQQRQRQLVNAEKFAAVGLLAAEVAHEINNPSTFVITNLTVMMDYVQTIAAFHEALRERIGAGDVNGATFDTLAEEHEIAFLSEDLDTLLERSLAGLNRIHQIVRDLRYFSQDRAADIGPTDLESLVHAAMNLVRHQARFHAEVVIEMDDLPRVRSDASRISQVILNVLVNAVQSIPAGEPEHNTVRVRSVVHDDTIDILVSDTGVGIPEEQLRHVFEPFFTTKEPGEGTGLGLSISRDIMRSLGGDISAESTVGEGSTFTIHVPRIG